MIIKLAGHYLEWVAGVPLGFGMTVDALKRLFLKRGKDAYGVLIRDLRVVEIRGTSEEGARTVDDSIRKNFAGVKGGPLAKEEIIEFYVRRRTAPALEELTKFRARLPKCDPCLKRKCSCWGSGVRY